MEKLKSIYSSAYASALTIILVVFMTIGAELSSTFKAWLTSFTGHHWVTKSWASICFFTVFFILFSVTTKSVNEIKTKKALDLLQIFIVLGFLVIFFFYLYEFIVK